MTDLTKLPDGTKLMWDASPNVFLTGMNVGKPIIYPATKIKNSTVNPLHGALIQTLHKRNWMGDEQEYLRLPTKQELETLIWEV
jgi:hypothetical protein